MGLGRVETPGNPPDYFIIIFFFFRFNELRTANSVGLKDGRP